MKVVPPIDRALLRLSRGLINLSAVQPVLLLESVGAKTGQTRSTPLLYIMDGDRWVLIASRGGNPRHPAWYHNLRKTPEASVLFRGRKHRVSAHEAEGEERARLWAKAAEEYLGYDVYQERAGARRIPVIVLTPLQPS